LCVPRREALLENDNISICLQALSSSSLIEQLPSRRIIPNQATATLKAHPLLGNYCPESSSPIGQLLGSSSIGKLLLRRSIPDWAITFVCAFRGEKPPLENHYTNIYL